MPPLLDFASRILHAPELHEVHYATLKRFLSLVSRIYPSIRSDAVNRERPEVPNGETSLPDKAINFLSAFLELEAAKVVLCWDTFRDWIPIENDGLSDDEVLSTLGVQHGLPPETLEPLIHQCQTEYCTGREITNRRSHTGKLYTLRRGILPIEVVSLYCHRCNTVYHHNYAVTGPAQLEAQRKYYKTETPKYIQVAQHIFVERELCTLFEIQMAFSHASAEAAARIYNLAIRTSESDEIQPETVLDGFFLHSLLRDQGQRDRRLILPHHGMNSCRLTSALRERNARIAGTGQQLWAHACDLCMKRGIGANGVNTRLTACVTDGVTVGHPCCSEPNCQTPLRTQRDRFCADHSALQFQCAVRGCITPSSAMWRTCDKEDHRALEERKREEGRALFRLRAKLARASGEIESRVPATAIEYLDELQPSEDTPEEPQTSGSRKLSARLTRRWTHNEQLMVRCCGIIIARATMFGSEAVTSVKNFIHATFPLHYPGSLPSFIFFDNNCQLLRHLYASEDPYDARLRLIALPVDVFHADTKHKEGDTFCQAHCNPAAFTELWDATHSWIFNSSAAEQANVWFGKFHGMVKEMSVERYNFFLDEMISIRNRWLESRLRTKGHKPHFVPQEDLERRI